MYSLKGAIYPGLRDLLFLVVGISEFIYFLIVLRSWPVCRAISLMLKPSSNESLNMWNFLPVSIHTTPEF